MARHSVGSLDAGRRLIVACRMGVPCGRGDSNRLVGPSKKTNPQRQRSSGLRHWLVPVEPSALRNRATSKRISAAVPH